MHYNISKYPIENRAFIDGRYVQSISGDTILKVSSVTGESLKEVFACDEKDVDCAVRAAKRAFHSGVWSEKTPAERKRAMLCLADLMEENLEELATLDAYETGRAFRNYVLDSIPKSIEAIRYFAEAVDKIYDKAISPRKNDFCVIVREPLGVVGIITPWNDPVVVAAWKFSPALLMGNSVVIKPAEQSSLSLIRIAALAKEAGIPDGVFNVVPGYGEKAGKALAMHNDVAGIFFTGSSEVGKLLIQYSGQSNMKRIALECGGKGPYIVTSGCKHLQEAASVLARNMFYNQGQICSAPSRVIVQQSVKEEFLSYLFAEAEQFVPNDPYEMENLVGCVVSREQYEKILQYIQIGKKEAKGVYIAGSKSDLPESACGVKPVIFYDLPEDSKVATEEIFGPVVCVLTYDTVQEAVEMANATKYGLAGAVWTENLDEAYYFANRIKVGLLHINSYGEDDNMSPFGGVKQSGNGKDKSVYAFDEYSELKSVWIKIRGEQVKV